MVKTVDVSHPQPHTPNPKPRDTQVYEPSVRALLQAGRQAATPNPQTLLDLEKVDRQPSLRLACRRILQTIHSWFIDAHGSLALTGYWRSWVIGAYGLLARGVQPVRPGYVQEGGCAGLFSRPLIRNCVPLGPYSRNMPRPLWWS